MPPRGFLPILQRQLVSFTETLPNDFQWIEPEQGSADIYLQIGGENVIAEWFYVVAAPFATIRDGVTLEEIQTLWTGGVW